MKPIELVAFNVQTMFWLTIASAGYRAWALEGFAFACMGWLMVLCVRLGQEMGPDQQLGNKFASMTGLTKAGCTLSGVKARNTRRASE